MNQLLPSLDTINIFVDTPLDILDFCTVNILLGDTHIEESG